MTEQLKVIISAEVDKFKKSVKSASDSIKDFVKDKDKMNEFNEEFQKIGNAAKTGLGIMAGAVTGAAAALLALGSSTEEFRINQAKLNAAFEQATFSTESATEVYRELYKTIGDDDQAVESAANIAMLASSEEEAAKWAEIASGVLGTFHDTLQPEAFFEAANETLKLGEATGAFTQMLEQTGVMSVEEFNAKLAECSTEAEKQALMLSTSQAALGSAGAAYDKATESIQKQRDAQAQMNEAMSKLGEITTPIMTMLTELGTKILADLTPYIQEFAEKYMPQIQEALSGVGEAIGKVISWIADNWELVSTLAAIVLGIAAALTVFSTVMGIVNAVMMASPITWIVLAIVAAIAALVAIIVVVIKHWDEIKAATVKCWNAIVDAVKKAIDWVVDLFKNMIDWVKENWEGLLLLLVNPFAGAFKLLYDNCEGFRKFIDDFVAKVKEVIKAGFELVKQYIIEPIKNAIQSCVDKFNELKTNVATKISDIASGIKNKFNEIKSNISNTVSNVFTTVSDKFNAIKEKISSAINGARDAVKGAIDKIKGFFNFSFSWPKIPMPKFSITPTGWKIGDLLKGSIPRLSISWNKLGGVFDKPTLFNYGGSLQGIGEDGAEAVVPLEKNTQWLDRLATMLTDKMGGNTPVVLEVDGKVFAETAISTINRQTRQTGKLALTIA